MKFNKIFIYLSWGWILLIIIASFIPSPKSIIRQVLRKLLSLVSRGDIDKQVHFLFYFIVVFLFTMAYLKFRTRLAICFTTMFISGIVEYLQPIITHGSRRADKIDLAYNIMGCISGLAFAFILEYLIGQLKLIRSGTSG